MPSAGGRRTEYRGPVLRDLIQLVLYALLAAFSPLAFAATMTVIQAGSRQAIGFTVGFVAAQFIACTLLLTLGYTAFGSSRQGYPGIRPPVALATAVVLVWLAGRVDRQPQSPTREHDPNSRSHILLIRLSRLGFFTTLAAGATLGIGGPKRLVLTALAASLIATSGAGDSGEAELVVVYAALATALVWAPVLFSLLRRDATVASMKRAQEWARRNHPTITIFALYGLAALFVVDAIVVFLANRGS